MYKSGPRLNMDEAMEMTTSRNTLEKGKKSNKVGVTVACTI
jgi:hypothetical protein